MERDPITAVVAENIKRMMAEREMDAANLARRARLNPTGIYDILSGKSRSPRLDIVAKIAVGLGVPSAAMFQRETDLLDQKSRELLSLMQQMPEAQKDLLLMTARAWL